MQYGQQGDFVAQAGHTLGFNNKCISRRVGGGTRHTVTMQVTTATNGATYAWTVTLSDGTQRALSVVAADGVAANIAAQIAAKLNADLLAGAELYATSSSEVVTFKALRVGVVFTVAESDAKLGSPSTTVSGAVAPALPFGRAVVAVVGNERRVQLPDNADFTKKVMTVTPGGTITADETYTVAIGGDFDGKGYKEHVFTYDNDASITAARLVDGLVAAINTRLDAAYGAGLSLVASNVTNVLTLTSEIEGLDFKVSASAVDNAGAAAAGTLAIATSTALVAPRFLGVSALDMATEVDDDTNEATVPGGRAARLVQEGYVFVEIDASEDPSLGDPVYVRFEASSAEKLGVFRASSLDGADCFPLPAGTARWADTEDLEAGAVTGVDGKRLALLYLDLSA